MICFNLKVFLFMTSWMRFQILIMPKMVLLKTFHLVADICSPILTQIWSNSTTPVLKRLITNGIKVFEKVMQKQRNHCINKFLWPFLCGYTKGYSTQFARMTLIEKWKMYLNQKGYTGAVLIVLSKVFDTINHKLLTNC